MPKKIKLVSRKSKAVKKVRDRRGRGTSVNKRKTPKPKKPKKKNKGGRPTKLTPETLNKLEAVWLNGGTDKEACFYADIATSTLYDYCAENQKFSERKELLKSNPDLAARKKIVGRLLDASDTDVELAKWWLARRLPEEFAPTNKVDGKVAVNTIAGLFGAAAEDDKNQDDDSGTAETET
jgi:hypothetical protein